MRKKVLVLDDDHDIVSVICYVLEDSGFETHSLYSGDTIMNAIEQFRPDLILMDIMLGNMDGRQICKDIKTHMLQPPIILISASHDVGRGLFADGAPDDFISKPFDIDHLINRVKHHCEIA